MSSSFVYASVRTPFGRFNGALADTRTDDLAATALKGLLDRSPGLDPGLVDDVFWGNANGAGEDNRNVGRMAVLLAGLPVSVPATTVNRLCGSSLDAAIIASRTLESGDADVVVAGGVESMTRAPWVLPKPDRVFPARDVTAVSTTLGWRLVNPAMPKEWTVSLGRATNCSRRGSPSPVSARTSSRRAHTGSRHGSGTTASTTTWSSPPTGSPATRASGPTRTPAGWRL